MKPKTRSPRWQLLRDLLALALIGFVLWLAAIGWLPIPSANAVPDAPEMNAKFRAVGPLNFPSPRAEHR